MFFKTITTIVIDIRMSGRYDNSAQLLNISARYTAKSSQTLLTGYYSF